MEYHIKLTPKLLQVLIDHEAELDFNNLIHEAISNNDLEIFKILIDRITCDVNELFKEAVQYHNSTMCTILIEHRADPTSIPMLYSLVSSDYSTSETLDLIKLLLGYHANLNELRHEGNPLLHVVRNVEIFKLLLNNGVHWRGKDHKGRDLKMYLQSKITKAQYLADESFYYRVHYCNNDLELYEEMFDILDEYQTMAITKKSQ
jgi:hypothetical protein